VTGEYDLVVVDVPSRAQVDRLVRDRGMTADQARARIAARATRDQRLTIAGVVIDNSGTPADLDRRVAELWKQWRARARS
jgi:dephospho-CoA kinase